MKRQHDNFIMLPTNDFCFKELMCNERVRKGFIAALLEIDPEEIKSTIVVRSETSRSSIDDKLGILDIKVEMYDGTLIDMEMQVEPYEYWDKRVLFYLGKTYTSQLKSGQKYKELKKCIHAGILNFIHFPDDEKCYRKIALCDVDSGKIYTDMLELHIMELKKLSKDSNIEKPIIRWMKFFNAKSRKEFEEMANIDDYIKEAYDELMKLSADGMKREEYEAREKALLDHYNFLIDAQERGEKIGMERGEKIGMERGEKIGMERGEKIGMERGEKIGMERGEKIGMERGEKIGMERAKKQAIREVKQVIKAYATGKSILEIAEEYPFTVEEIREIIE